MSEQEVFDALKYRIEVDSYGNRCYYDTNGQLHRTDGPALEYADGSKSWYQNGLLHRLDGPAVVCANGAKYWWQNGLLHRIDGPAIILPDGRKWWYLNDRSLTEDEFNQAVKLL